MGETVTFKIGSVTANESADWQEGAGQQVDLTASAPFMPWGRVTLDGENVLTGTLVSAWYAGVKYAEQGSTWVGGQSQYALEVPHDNLATPDKEG